MSTEKRNEDLVPGDVVNVWGASQWHTIASIEPYTGPLTDIVFAIAKFRPGASHPAMSLERGGYCEVA